MNILFNKKAQELLEALRIDPETNKLDFNYSGKDGLHIVYGKSKSEITFEPFESNSKDFGGYRVISLFSTSHIKGDEREQIVTPILKALKGQSTVEVNKDEFRQWLKRAGYVMGKYIRDNIKPDAVLAIKSSSHLNNLFVQELAAQLPGVQIIPDAITKADIDNITIDPKANETRRKNAERELKKAKQAGSISFKKIHVSLRPLFKGVMKGNVEDIANVIEGKVIMVLDDQMTTRSTQIHAIDVIRQYNPKDIVGVTLFKS